MNLVVEEGKQIMICLHSTTLHNQSKQNEHTLTGSLHVFQFDVNVAGVVEWKCGLGPWDHWCVDHIQRTVSDSLTCLSEHLDSNAVC